MIQIEHLTKAFGPRRVVDDLTFNVERGEVLGFLGPNGAGKSTTMRMITGFIPPSAGRVTVGGFDMVENPIPGKRRTTEQDQEKAPLIGPEEREKQEDDKLRDF